MNSIITSLQSSEPTGYPIHAMPTDEVAFLKQEVADVRYQQALDRQRIAALELALDAASSGRRNYKVLASKLLRELHKRGTAMDYRDIRNFFRFSEDKEAYRLLQLTHKMYPGDTKILNATDKKHNIAIVYRGERL